MSDPATAVTRKDHCSVINNGTLYVFSEDGMQSLALKEGGTWDNLPMGVSVQGGTCVLAPSDDESKSAMFVVGGSANSSTSDYPGLQRYTFSSQKWDTIKPIVPVTQNRRNHGAAFLKDSSSILVYAGAQDTAAPTLSSQTFLVSTSPPYDVLSFTSTAPPVTQPQVMPWNDSHAIMVGGGTDNKEIFTFGQEGWANLGTTLENGLGGPAITGCEIVTGDDGSKVLVTFDLSSSPNSVARIVLWANGAPAKPGQTVGDPASSGNSRKRKRGSGLSLADWPPYNNSLAPTIKRDGVSLASDGSGLTVISGGSPTDSIAVFDQRQNSWVNATQLLGSQAPLSVSSPGASPTTTTSASSSASSISPPTSSSSSSSSSTAAPLLIASGNNGNHKTLTVLGATLGAIFGLAAILIIVLLLLRWKREKRKREGAGYLNEKNNDRLSFADQGAEFMHEAGGTVGHNYSASMTNSLTSLNIIAGKTAGTKSAAAHKRNGGALGSDASTRQLIAKKPSPLGFNDPVEMEQMRSEKDFEKPPIIASQRGIRTPPAAVGDPFPAPVARGQSPMTSRPISRSNDARPTSSSSASRGGAIVGGMGGAGSGTSRSSGWSKYFTNNDHTTNLAGGALGARKTSVSSDTSASQYTNRGSAATHPSQTVQPLELNLGPKFDGSSLGAGERVSSVSMGSPTMGHSRDHSSIADTPSQRAELLARSASGKSAANDSTLSVDFTFGSTTPGGGASTNTWTPVSASPWQSPPATAGTTHSGGGNGLLKPHESLGGSSAYSGSTQFPLASYYANSAYDGERRHPYGSSNATPATPTPTPTWPIPPRSAGYGDSEARDSTVTVFPGAASSSPVPPVPSSSPLGAARAGYGQDGAGQSPAKKKPVGEDTSWLNLNATAGGY